MNTKRMIDYWVIPPENNAEFVTCMEEVLETYEKPSDPAHPVICMDEQPVRLSTEVREPNGVGPMTALAARSSRPSQGVGDRGET